ncbi:unnamed protein product, partial [Ectocarpus sp. 12 AP-2014]
DVKSDGRISVAKLLACLKQMDFILEGSPEDLIRSVVPAAMDVDRLSLNDAIKVATAAKTQERGSAPPQRPGIGREGSLAELESSFNKQIMLGEITADAIEEEPRVPSVGFAREDSLAQLESSFHNQINSGNIPAAIVEGPAAIENAPPPAVAAVGLAVPVRRRSIAGSHPVPSSPSTTAPRPTSRGSSFSSGHGQGREPEVVVDNFPKRRMSVASSGSGSLKGLRADSVPGPGGGGGDDDDSTLPASPEMLKLTSEMELLDSAGSLGVEPVITSAVPKRRSITVSQSWREAAAQ